MNYLINKYIKEQKNIYQTKTIAQSSLSNEIILTLKEQSILTIYDLLTASEEILESIFNNTPKSLEEIQEYIFSIHSDIMDEMDSFPKLEEWNMFLDAVNEQVSLDPLTCVLCYENQSAFSMNIADNININVCNECSKKIKEKICDFLITRDLW